jgi:hypothetical protein
VGGWTNCRQLLVRNSSEIQPSSEETLGGIVKLKAVFGIIGIVLFCHNAQAQESKTLDLFLGYSYTRIYPSNVSGLGPFPLNGGDAAVSYKLNRWITGVADFNVSAMRYTNSDIVGIQLHGTQTTYLFGPRITLPRWRRVTPFGEALFGLGHASFGLYDTASAQNSFAWVAGGGFDFRLNNSIHLRPLEVDFLQTRFSEIKTGSQSQNNLRVATGIVLRF